MAIIPQKELFGWKEIENIGDLERLRLVIDYFTPLIVLILFWNI